MFYFLLFHSFNSKKSSIFAFIFTIRTSFMIDLKDLPVLRDIDNKTKQISLGNDLQLSLIKGKSKHLPEYFQTAAYAFNLHIKGKWMFRINHREYKIKAPCFSSILINQAINLIESSKDSVQYVLGFSPKFAEDLHLNLVGYAHVRAYMRPILPLNHQQMQIAIHYFDLLREIMQLPNIMAAREVALDLVRSMIHFIYGLYDLSFHQLNTLSRSEELVGQFLTLVELHSHEQHHIEWYADELCLTPKYVANMVKKVTGRTASNCINENLIRQAKLLLLTTTLSVQQIADRLGFKNQSHFGTFFRRFAGMSPRTYREKKLKTGKHI